VANSLDGTVSRVDPATDAVVATVHVGEGPSDVAVGGGGVWAASEARGTVTRLDPETNTAVATIDVASAPRCGRGGRRRHVGGHSRGADQPPGRHPPADLHHR
jgi:YVTN family beta-propeller protein